MVNIQSGPVRGAKGPDIQRDTALKQAKSISVMFLILRGYNIIF